MHAFKEKTIGLLVFGGCGTSIVFAFFSWFLLVGLGVSGIQFQSSSDKLNAFLYVCIAISVIGLIAGVVGIAWGLLASRTEFKGPQTRVERARVVARYALDRLEAMYTDDYSIANLDRPRFFVRLDIGGSETVEYQCVEAVFWEAGEGMHGEAMVQGKWLGSFRPYFGPEQGIQDDRVARL